MLHMIGRIFGKKKEYVFDFAEAKRKTHIILIDNDSNVLPIKDLSRDGYVIQQEKLVDPELLRKCEEGRWDIILLDYNGIAPKSVTPDDGFGVFDRIRSTNPAQYIIAVSGQAYDISKTEYLRRANDWLGKPIDLASAKDKIDKGIRYLFDRAAVLERFRQQIIADGFSIAQADKLVREFQDKKIDDIEDAVTRIRKICGIVNVTASLVGITRTLVKLSGSP